jgi:hypothetical protein
MEIPDRCSEKDDETDDHGPESSAAQHDEPKGAAGRTFLDVSPFGGVREIDVEGKSGGQAGHHAVHAQLFVGTGKGGVGPLTGGSVEG